MKDLKKELDDKIRPLLVGASASLVGALVTTGHPTAAQAAAFPNLVVAMWEFLNFRSEKYIPTLKQARWDCLPRYIQIYFENHPELSYLGLWKNWD
jgi:hypothetical protein